MTHDPRKWRRRSIRLKGYDYTQAGGYFITLVAHDRQCLFGEIINGEMRLNEYGAIVTEEWNHTAMIRPNVELDAFVVMPNHIHGIIMIVCRGESQFAPTETIEPKQPFRSPSGTIGAIIRGFKSATTKRINQSRNTPGVPVWQRNYYEHIIRNDKDLHAIQGYIVNNALQWELDRENPSAAGEIVDKKETEWLA